MRKCLPLRWIPEAEAGLYSDHGITLAGYIVEIISGEKYQDFVRRSIMKPLGMKRTGYAEPGKPLGEVAVGYSYSNNRYEASEFVYTSIDPAIGVLTTGSDAARLIIAHLTGKPRLLKPDTMRLMHDPQYSDDSRLGVEWTCGFYRTGFGEPVIYHHGQAMNFASQIAILPESQIGLFVSQNSEAELVFQVGDLQRLIGTNLSDGGSGPKQPVARLVDGSNLEALAGNYVANRTLSRGKPIRDEDFVRVRHVKEVNALEVEHSSKRGHPIRFVETEPQFFYAVQGDQQISFRKSPDGKRMYLFDFNFTGDGQHTKPLDANPLGSPKDEADSKVTE